MTLLMLALACGGPTEAERIAALPDPVPALVEADALTRVAALRRIAETDPQRLGRLCPALPPDARDACRRLEGRPHLRVAPTPVRAAPRVAPGPASAALVPDPTLRSRLSPAPDRGSCPDAAPPCLTRAALALEPEAAAARCLAIDEPPGRKECLFQVAERLAEDPARAADVAELCLAAEDFAPRCLGHTTNRLARAAAQRYGDGQDEALLAGAEALAAPWRDRDAPLQEALLQRYWSAALEAVVLRMPSPGGAAFQDLPPEAQPQLHAALAAHLYRPQSTEMDEVVRSLSAALAAPTPPRPWPGSAAAPLPKVALWTRDESEEDGQIPAVVLRETSRRAVSADPAVDLAICALEAAAREPDGEALLQAGLAHPDPLVRWTAARLSRARAPR